MAIRGLTLENGYRNWWRRRNGKREHKMMKERIPYERVYRFGVCIRVLKDSVCNFSLAWLSFYSFWSRLRSACSRLARVLVFTRYSLNTSWVEPFFKYLLFSAAFWILIPPFHIYKPKDVLYTSYLLMQHVFSFLLSFLTFNLVHHSSLQYFRG